MTQEASYTNESISHPSQQSEPLPAGEQQAAPRQNNAGPDGRRDSISLHPSTLGRDAEQSAAEAA